MLQDQPISINYGKGLDTKSDQKTVQTGKMLRLENAVFTESNRINKRPGFDQMTMSVLGGGTISSPTLTSSFNNELVTAATVTGATSNGQRLFSYSPQEDRWVDKGKYISVKAESKFVGQGTLNRFNPTTAILNNIAIFASSGNAGNQFPLYVSVWDMNNEEALLSDFNLVNTASYYQAACVTLGNSQLAIVYELETGVGPGILFQLFLQTITVTPSGGVVFGSRVSLASTNTNYFPYTMVGTTTGATIVYDYGTATAITIDPTGAITHTATGTFSNGTDNGAIAFDSTTGYNWIYWNPSARVLDYTVLDSTLATILAPTQIDNLTLGPLSTVSITSITAVNVAPHIQQVAYGFGVGSPTDSIENNFVYQAQVNDSGSILIPRNGLASFSQIYSQLFTMQDTLGNNIPYISISNYNIPAGQNNAASIQPTIFVMDATIDTTKSTKGVIARVFWESAGPGGSTLASSALTNGVNMSSVISLSPTKVLIAATKNIASAEIPQNAYNYFTLDFANQDINQALPTPSNVLLNGGIITSYDGQAAVESGFNLFPEIRQSSTTTGGTLLDGTYLVYATYRWVDAFGNVQESAPSIPLTVVFSSNSNTNVIHVYVPYLTITQKQTPRQDLGIAIYITAPNEVTPYLYPNSTSGSGVSTIITFTNLAGVNYQNAGYNMLIPISTPPDPNNPILYTTGGILDNDPPPPSTAMVVHNNRVQLVDSLNPNSQWYSKSITPGTAVSFSGLLLNQIDAHAGAIVALAEMDDKLVLLAEKSPIIISGDGANDAGTGSSLSFPQFIPSDVGCSQSKGVITSPLGVHFKTPKGLYLLDRSTSLKYWGYPVEEFNNQDVTNTIIMPGTTQIRFLTDSGLTLMYDYFQDQWGTFTNFQGVSATIWEGLYVYARSDGFIYKENDTSFLDSTLPYAVTAQTAWIKGSLIQGFQRLKQFLHVGDYTNGSSSSHGVQVSIAYDYLSNPSLPGFSAPVAYYFNGNPNTSGTFQYRQFIAQQKCEAGTFLIQELPTGASGENFDITDMTMVVGIKKGPFKLPANTQSVG